MGSNESQQLAHTESNSQFMSPPSTQFQHFDTPGILEFFEQYYVLPEDAQNSLTNICGPYFPGSLLQIASQPDVIHDPDVFLSVCFTLVKQSNLNALITWTNIPRGQDIARLHISEDRNTIDVSISRQIGYTATVITSRLKEAGEYFEPTRQLWSYGPQTHEQYSRVFSYPPFISQNSSFPNFDASKIFDRAPTPPLPDLSVTPDSNQHYFQQSGSAATPESSLKRTSSTSTVRDFIEQQVDSPSDSHRSLSAAPSFSNPSVQPASDGSRSPLPLSAAQTLLNLSEQQPSDGQRSPLPSQTLLNLNEQQAGGTSDGRRPPLPLSPAPTLTAASFEEQQAESTSDGHRSLSSATLTTGSFSGSVSDGHRSPLSATPTLVSIGSGLSRHGSSAA